MGKYPIKACRLLAGIRQSGVLSPVLFSTYVNDMLDKFAKFGCYFKGIAVSAIIYADDIIEPIHM
jgi:hypothetical protein